MNKLFLFFALVLVSKVNLFSQTPPETDVQFWNETTITIPLVKKKESDKLSLFFNGVLRFGDNVSRPVDERIGFGFDYKINKYLGFSPSYLYVAAQPVRGRREYESRLRFAVNLEKKFKKFSLRDRNLIEFRLRNSRSNSTRYRNKLQLNYPVLKAGKEYFTPFVSDEVYYDFQARAWTRNDFSAGLSKKLNKNLSADFFYLLRNNRGNTLKYVNIFGVNLKIKID
jgi:hypothetical protein